MDQKQLLRQLWETQAENDACKFQLQTEEGPTEYLVCSRAVMLDYSPEEKLEPGKLYKVNTHPLKKMQDISKANPENMLCEESLTIHTEDALDSYFLPLNTWKEIGLGVFDVVGDTAILKTVLPYLKGGSFQFAGLAMHHIPDQVRWNIRKSSKFLDLNPRIGKMRTGPVLVLLLSCDSALLIVTLTKNANKSPMNEHIYMDKARTDLYRLDGLREDGVFFSRLVKGKATLKGLANPTKRKAEEPVVTPAAVPTPETAGSVGDSVTVEELQKQEAPAVATEPQVEEVQPQQAAKIAEEAPVVNTVETAEEPKKRTRAPRKVTPKDSTGALSGQTAKLMDDLIAYLCSQISDQMSVEAMQEESRKLRDLGVAMARRQSNLLVAATASEKKLRDVLRGVLGK